MDFNKEDIEKLDIIIKDFETFREKITNIDYIHNKVDFFDLMKKFRKYIAHLDSSMYNIFYHSKFFKFYKDFFTDINEYYLRSIESIQSLSVMTQWIHNFNSFSEMIDRELLKESFNRKYQELEPGNFENIENFVIAWCWPFPETLLFVHENIKVKNILWLDYNHEAIYMAWEMINWLWIDNISFKQINAIEFNYSEADVVSIPIFVPKKTEIINQIIETWKEDVQIIVTCPKWFLNLIYKWLWENLTPRAKITYRQDIKSDYINQEILKIEKYEF